MVTQKQNINQRYGLIIRPLKKVICKVWILKLNSIWDGSISDLDTYQKYYHIGRKINSFKFFSVIVSHVNNYQCYVQILLTFLSSHDVKKIYKRTRIEITTFKDDSRSTLNTGKRVRRTPELFLPYYVKLRRLLLSRNLTRLSVNYYSF